jgi:hypothetical protein
MSDVSSVMEIILLITRDVWSTKTTKKTYLPLRLKQYTPPTQMKQILHTQLGITYAHITKQNSYAVTNIELLLNLLSKRAIYRT